MTCIINYTNSCIQCIIYLLGIITWLIRCVIVIKGERIKFIVENNLRMGFIHFSIISITRTFIGSNSQCTFIPCSTNFRILFIIDNFVHLNCNMIGIVSRNSTYSYIRIIITTYYTTEHRIGRCTIVTDNIAFNVCPVTYNLYIKQIIIGIIGILNKCFNICTC